MTSADDAAARVRRRLAYRLEEDGSLSVTLRLPPLQGAVLLQALRAASDDLEHSHEKVAEHPREAAAPGGVSAGTSPAVPTGPSQAQAPDSSSLADALVTVAESFLAGKAATAANPDVYQVIVHVGADALAGGTALAGGAATAAGSMQSAGRAGAGDDTQPAGAGPVAPGRCHVEDGPAISVTTAQMIGCEATLSWMRHDRDGSVLDVGRRRRRPGAALRRAARERDKGRCRFPGCESRRVDLHHIQYWSNGGRTSLKNLVSLCKRHHQLVHDRGYLITAAPGGGFTFTRPDGTALPASPALPDTDGTITGCHDAGITPETIVPAWYGERLDLDYAVDTCFANATHHEQAQAA